jgi:putative ABC transport system permease protein
LFIAAEVALSIVLLVGAGLLMRSFVRMTNVSLRFDADNLLVATTQLMGQRYTNSANRDTFFRELQQRVAAVPGITGVTVATSLPPDGGFSFDVTVEPEGQPARPVQGRIGFNFVANNFFNVMGIPILRGRSFGGEDTPQSPPMIVVSRTMAERFWPDMDPIGRRVRFQSNGPWLTVVGVAADLGRRRLDAADYTMDYYGSATQNGWRGQMVLITRNAADSTTMAALIKKEMWAVDPNQPIVSLRTASETLAESTAEPRFYLILMSIFASSAMLLAAVGIYGVVSHAVVQRTAEIGIRMSLGARRADVFRLIFARVAAVTTLGLTLGLFGAFALKGLLSGLLFELSPADPIAFAASVPLLCFVALIGGGIPAFRATRMDPLSALRVD